MKSGILLALIFLFSFFLTGCDNGSSSGSTPINGIAIDGYIRGATACLDKNYNSRCNTAEPRNTTNESGGFELYVNPGDTNNYPIVVYAAGGAYDTERKRYYSDSTPLILTAPNGVSIITPITTLIKQEINDGYSRKEAEERIAALLNIPIDKLYVDYIKTADPEIANIAKDVADCIIKERDNYENVFRDLESGNCGLTPSNNTKIDKITANSFEYTMPTGLKTVTFSWQKYSAAHDSANKTLSATLKHAGSKGSIDIDHDKLTFTPYADMNGNDGFVLTISNTSGISIDITVTVVGIDTSPPSITSTHPFDGESGVPLNSAISATFSEEMDSDSITSHSDFLQDSFGNTVSGTISHLHNTFLFSPDSNLSSGSTYTATLTTSIKDAYGNPLSSNYTFRFTTSNTHDTTPPILVMSIPVNGASDVSINSSILLNFSEPIKPSSISNSTLVLKDSSNTAVACDITFIDTSTIKLTPLAHLRPKEQYKVTIAKSITDMANNSLATNESIAFTTANNRVPIALNFTYTTPIKNTAKTFDWLSLSGAYDVNGDTLSAAIATQSSKGSASISGNNMTYTPNANAEGSDSVVLAISDGNGGSTQITATLVGIDTIAPTITATDPADGANPVTTHTWLDINFSEPLNTSTLTTSTILLNNGKSCQKIDYLGGSGNTVRCYPYVTLNINALNEGTTYTLTLKGAIEDSIGNPMGTDAFITFTTGKTNILPKLRTGWTTCFDEWNIYTTVDCASPTALKDDAWYVANTNLGIPRSFTKNTNTVIDNATALEWQDNPDVSNAGNKKLLHDAQSYCDNLNLDGKTSWRVPNVHELASIVDRSQNAATVTFAKFANTSSYKYWSDTELDAVGAWSIDFSTGVEYSSHTYTELLGTRCVQGAEFFDSNFTRNDSTETVLDSSSGLMWQDDSNTENTHLDQMNAIDYCENLNLAGYSDWRLPNINELFSIKSKLRYEYIPIAFRHISSTDYWSSSSDGEMPGYGWLVYFRNLNSGKQLKYMPAYVRCVRGGY